MWPFHVQVVPVLHFSKLASKWTSERPTGLHVLWKKVDHSSWAVNRTLAGGYSYCFPSLEPLPKIARFLEWEGSSEVYKFRMALTETLLESCIVYPIVQKNDASVKSSLHFSVNIVPKLQKSNFKQSAYYSCLSLSTL